jgi:oxygen-independent coproporphyrinogen-3 oxidase
MVVGHLYLHVPFCPKICPYCSFYKQGMREGGQERYVEAVLRELDSYLDEGVQLVPATVFMGGGTPSSLSMKLLERLLNGLRERVDLSRLKEWTLEMNPATVSAQKAKLLRDLGVTRASMGAQSWEPHVLETLGRVHSAQQALDSYAILREAGLPAVNLDLIFAVPGQSLEDWKRSLRRTVELRPDHISSYNLTYEEDTEFFKRFQAGEFSQYPEEDAEFFEFTEAFLAEHGYEAYEISNVAPPGQECLHNLAYWHGADYLGLGPSAFSTVGEERWQNIADTATYTAAMLNGHRPIGFREDVPPQTRRHEQIVFGLRTSRGVGESLLRQTAPTAVEALLAEGLLAPSKTAPANLSLTSRGRLLADEIGELFLTDAADGGQPPQKMALG